MFAFTVVDKLVDAKGNGKCDILRGDCLIVEIPEGELMVVVWMLDVR